MNAGCEVDHVSIQYYDGDYPSETLSPYPENFDETTRFQGLSHDVARYRQLAAECIGAMKLGFREGTGVGA